MREGEPVFVDTGAWIALALSRDPLHARAVELWESLQGGSWRVVVNPTKERVAEPKPVILAAPDRPMDKHDHSFQGSSLTTGRSSR